MPERIQYTLCTAVYKRSSTTVSVRVDPATVRRRLTSFTIRSASTAEVLVPATRRSTIGDRALAVAGPRFIPVGPTVRSWPRTQRTNPEIGPSLSNVLYQDAV